jgi:hypothetical protein
MAFADILRALERIELRLERLAIAAEESQLQIRALSMPQSSVYTGETLVVPLSSVEQALDAENRLKNDNGLRQWVVNLI